MSIDNALQTAIYTALAAGAYPVYDHVPADADYPYIVIASRETAQQDMLTARLEEHFFYLSIYSDYQGQAQCNTIADYIDTRLHRVKHTLSTGQVCKTAITRRRVTPDLDGQTYQGSITVAAIVQPS